MLIPALPAQCVPDISPEQAWPGTLALCGVFLFAATTALLQPGRGRVRFFAALPLASLIWAGSLALWMEAAQPGYVFRCQNFPGQPPGGWFSTNPQLQAMLDAWGTATIVLTVAVLGMSLAALLVQRRKAKLHSLNTALL